MMEGEEGGVREGYECVMYGTGTLSGLEKDDLGVRDVHRSGESPRCTGRGMSVSLNSHSETDSFSRDTLTPRFTGKERRQGSLHHTGIERSSSTSLLVL